MTQDEIMEMAMMAGFESDDAYVQRQELKALVNLVAAKEREALAQTQEPVAYWNFNNGFSHCMIDQLNEAAKKNPAPLYTTPPQRTWVRLTDEELADCMDMSIQKTCRAIEAKLKEKNT